MLESYLKDLAEIVDFDSGSCNTAGVTRAAEIMKRHYESIGWSAELVDLGETVGRGLFATNKPGAEKFDILFNAHLDTVFADGTAAERPFAVADGRATGPGCADCKAGVTAIFHALKNARPEDLGRLAIAVCHNPDEEISSPASRGWLQDMAAKSRFAVVCEASRPSGAFVRARKGRSVWRIVVHGTAAHAGNNPQDGRSAVLAAAHLTIALTALQDLETKGTSVTVGVISGGTVCNIVPDTCTMELDVRYRRDEDGQEIDEAIAKLCRRSWGESITVEAERTILLPAMALTDSSKTLVELVEKSAGEEGIEPAWVDAGGGSDANLIAKTGTPVVDGLGPVGGGFHSAREYMEIGSVEGRVRMLSRLLTHL